MATFETSAAVMHGTTAPTRYAVRQVLDLELKRTKALRERAARQARFKAGNPHAGGDVEFDAAGAVVVPRDTIKRRLVLPLLDKVKKDFFGRVIKTEEPPATQEGEESGGGGKDKEEAPIWVTFHEGMNNAVRKPLTLDELMRGF